MKTNLINWLEKRIEKSQKEHDERFMLVDKASKGGKLCAYKDCLAYIKKHPDRDILLEVMNLGMSLRQDQFNGFSDRSGVEVLDEWISKNLK